MTINEAAERLRAGDVVAFPTETVYGLGANALDAEAVKKIYALKGRPSTSPLIVHVSSIEMAKTVAREWPPLADELARRYWPGPLSLVLPKQLYPRLAQKVHANGFARHCQLERYDLGSWDAEGAV